MKLKHFIIAAVCALVAAPIFADGQQINQLNPQDAKAWVNYTVPLPKQIEVKAEAVLPAGTVGLEIKTAEIHPVYDQIREEFVGACGSHNDASGDPKFWIRIQIGGEEAEPLKTLNNSNQAYRISTSNDNKSLTIVSLDHRGAYYGWKTVQQLIKGRSTADKLRIPILTVTDWPDMEKRGLWGSDNYNHLAWLSERKMNHMEQINARSVDDKGQFYAHTRDQNKLLDTDCERYAIDYVPVVLHLEQIWQEETMGKFYPQMKAKNATHGGALCYSEPKTVEMISAWIYQLAIQSPSNEVDVWMSENLQGKSGCQCEKCKPEHHTVNEARAIVKAWEMAKQKLGKYITLYVLTSEATEASNPKIFSELPKDIRVWYYHSLYTYNSIRQPMIRPYLVDAVKNGRWLGVCPNLDAWTHTGVPFTGAAFTKYRMTEFLTKGLKGLLGYATPRVYYHKFNVEASAEWTWNLKGRTTKEFAYSYAVRQGYKDPTKFAEWSETLGQVSWDVYGSGWPAGQKKNQGVKVKTALKDGTLPALGFVDREAWPTPWGNIKSEQQLDADIAAAQKALKLAKQLDIPQYTYETLVVDGYIRTLKSLYELKKLAPKGHMFAPSDQNKAKVNLKMFLDGADQVVENLPKWERCVVSKEEKGLNSVDRPVSIMKEVAEDVKTTVAEMGVKVR